MSDSSGRLQLNMRKVLVVFQFAVSVILIISTVVIYKQVQFVKDRQVGYTKEHLVYMNLQGDLRKKFAVIKNELLKAGVAKNVALSSSPVFQHGANTGDYSWPGKEPDKEILITISNISPEFISTTGMKIIHGRDYRDNISSDSNSVIINESLAKIIGTKNIIGTPLKQEGGAIRTVVGVVKDFVYNNVYAPAAPLMLFADTSRTSVLNIKLLPGASLNASLTKVEKIIREHNPGYPVEMKFVDTEFDKLFTGEKLTGKIALIFSLLAVVISCLGLFGLSAYAAERRKKEVGIRKVLGASPRGLAALLTKDFMELVIVACLLAFPVAWWLMEQWLQNYSYRIKMGWTVFLMSGLIAVIIALVTISYQAIKAAVANPVKNLRFE
jgi:putative ABC transport system permease protein